MTDTFKRIEADFKRTVPVASPRTDAQVARSNGITDKQFTEMTKKYGEDKIPRKFLVRADPDFIKVKMPNKAGILSKVIDSGKLDGKVFAPRAGGSRRLAVGAQPKYLEAFVSGHRSALVNRGVHSTQAHVANSPVGMKALLEKARTHTPQPGAKSMLMAYGVSAKSLANKTVSETKLGQFADRNAKYVNIVNKHITDGMRPSEVRKQVRAEKVATYRQTKLVNDYNALQAKKAAERAAENAAADARSVANKKAAEASAKEVTKKAAERQATIEARKAAEAIAANEHKVQLAAQQAAEKARIDTLRKAAAEESTRLQAEATAKATKLAQAKAAEEASRKAAHKAALKAIEEASKKVESELPVKQTAPRLPSPIVQGNIVREAETKIARETVQQQRAVNNIADNAITQGKAAVYPRAPNGTVSRPGMSRGKIALGIAGALGVGGLAYMHYKNRNKHK